MEQLSRERLSPLVWKAFLRLLPLQIIEIIVFAINGFVDSVITSHFLGEAGVAAIGLFGPVAMVISITDMIIFGTQILCGRSIGSGDGDRVVSLFSTGVVFLSGISLAVTLACLLFRDSLAALLGAGEQLLPLVADYITGYAPGIIGQVLMGMLLVFLPFNNDIRRCYLGIGVMVASNTLLDLLLVGVWNTGTLGMGIATSCSYLLAMAVMIPGFVSRKKAVHFRWKGFCFDRLPEAALFGLPSLMWVIGATARGYILNLTLMSHVGTAAVAAMTVQGNVCAIVGAVPMGCANAFLTIGSVYYGEEDRHSLVALMRFSLLLGSLLSAASAALLMLFSGPLASLFFHPAAEAWPVTRRMLLLFPCFLIPNILSSLFLKAYQMQKRTALVNTLSLAGPLFMAFFALLLIGPMGPDAVWLSFPFSETLCVLIIAVSVILRSGKPTLSLTEWMKLPQDFGASPEECLEFSVNSMDQVLQLSVRIIDFCRKRQIDERRSTLMGLCVEEMVGNVVEHGFRPGENHHVEVRVVARDALIVCVRDDCRAFDPKSRLDQFDPEDVTRNIGIRMIAAMSEEMSYQCTAGINTLLIRV